MTHSAEAGRHWILDLHGCPADLLDDHDAIRDRLREVTERFDLTLLGLQSHRFEPQGVTAVGLLAESHFSIHTWPETGFAAIDIFTCGRGDTLDEACLFLIEAFRAEDSRLVRLSRGVTDEAGKPLAPKLFAPEQLEAAPGRDS
jgi:S-adenosylmethionine decarboxylase